MKKRSENDFREMEVLFKEHHTLLCLVAFGIMKDRDAAKDVVQDFFVSYWQRKDQISHSVSFKAYAIKAVKNLSLLSVERSQREKSLLRNLDLRNGEEPKTSKETNRKIKLEGLLNRLPEKRRQIFMSVVVHGQSYSEIAENKGISINTVKTQMKRAYAFLRKEAHKDWLYFLLFAFSLAWSTFTFID